MVMNPQSPRWGGRRELPPPYPVEGGRCEDRGSGNPDRPAEGGPSMKGVAGNDEGHVIREVSIEVRMDC